MINSIDSTTYGRISPPWSGTSPRGRSSSCTKTGMPRSRTWSHSDTCTWHTLTPTNANRPWAPAEGPRGKVELRKEKKHRISNEMRFFEEKKVIWLIQLRWHLSTSRRVQSFEAWHTETISRVRVEGKAQPSEGQLYNVTKEKEEIRSTYVLFSFVTHGSSQMTDRKLEGRSTTLYAIRYLRALRVNQMILFDKQRALGASSVSL